MAELAVVGDSEFAMGFALIGIKKIYESDSDVKKCFEEALDDPQIGIIVTNKNALNKLDYNFRRQVENSVTPVVVTLSTDEFAQQNLRDMIKKAIGIDLMAK